MFTQDLEKDYSALISEYEARIKALGSTSQKIGVLRRALIVLEQETIPHWQHILSMELVDIYNTYLNKEYQEALISEPQYALIKLKTPFDYCYGNRAIQNSTQEYVVNAQKKLAKANYEYALYSQQIQDCESEVQRNNEELIFTKERLRFLQQRILTLSN